MSITTVLVPPSRGSAPDTFSAQADAFLTQLPAWTTEANALATAVNADGSTASAAAATATTKAGEALASASSASGSAATATSQAGIAAGHAGAASASAGDASGFASAASASAAAAAASAGSMTTVDVQTHAATSKTTPVDADEIPLSDSAAAWGVKKLTWANLKATAKAYFDTLYQAADADLTSWAGIAPSTKQDTLVSATNIKTINSASLLGSGDIVIAASSAGAFYKTDPTTVAFTKTGAGTAQIKAGTKIDVLGTLVTFASATSITMPTLTAGTDYAVWVKDDATIQATTNFSSAPGAGNWRKIGGFHYAPGGNAAAQAGGDTTPAINAYSLWDVNFRPACQDPRGMTLVGDSFWADIYLLGVDHLTNGTSKYNVTIADGSSPPKIPTKFGGNGSTAYGTLNWWEGAEVLNAWGKRYPKYDEFAALAYGTTEASSVGADPGSTVLNAAYTSRWGCVQSSGCLWVWGANFGGGAAAAAWVTNTGGRGDTYQMENAVRFGGAWAGATNSGSRASLWYNSPTLSGSDIGVRAVCDHLILG